MIRRLSLLLALVAALAIGCDGEVAPPGSLGSLAGTSWAVSSVGGAAPVNGAVPTLTFDATTVKGSGGCNQIGGRYQLDPSGRFALTEFGGTAMGCVQAGVTEFETAFMQALAVANQASVGDQGQLILSGAGPVVVLVRIEPPSG